jgi:hypothetical protein
MDQGDWDRLDEWMGCVGPGAQPGWYLRVLERARELAGSETWRRVYSAIANELFERGAPVPQRG